KKPAAASPCTASLVFSSQSLECQDSNDMESQANSSNTDSKAESTNQDSSNSKIVSEKCGLQGKSQGSLLNANDRRDFSQLPYLSPQAELPTYGVVLMQNSGLSNALSPLTSLNYTFKIPILGFVSLRGERDSSGKNTDEPQHELLGVITDTLLETCEMKYAFLDSDMDRAKMQVQEALEWLEKGESFFFIVKNKTFSKVMLTSGHSVLSDKSANLAALTSSKLLVGSLENADFSSQSLECQIESNHPNLNQDTRITDSQAISPNHQTSTTILECQDSHNMESLVNFSDMDSNNTESKLDSKPTQPASKMPTRLEALSVLHTLAKDSKALLLATTGKCGRELYEIEDSPNQLYMVGSMGCVSSLSLGIALKSRQKVIAIDGDSALLMRLGALSTNAYYTRNRDNFCHILLDNESHDSTGGQITLSPFVDFGSIAKLCGYVNVYIAESLEEFESYAKAFLSAGHSVLSDKSAICKCGNADFPSQSLECQSSSDTESLMDSHNAVSKSLKSKTNPSNLDSKKGAWFIYLKIQKGSKENLGRPKVTPQEVAQRLSEYMRECSDEF
ncbi:thiamine pyrophosphate-dependent enzyme, partial [uncultured Helicobacter sp.]|uniref:thiamine pyrophosphate-dependent enzyme n=1 Tax=uncultured Helicobacter sp. TaxID=175537 RepID=UPI003416729C